MKIFLCCEWMFLKATFLKLLLFITDAAEPAAGEAPEYSEQYRNS